MRTLYLLLLLIPLALTTPVTAQKNNKEEKAAQLEKSFQELKDLVAGNHFKIVIDRVYPYSGHDVSRFNPRGELTITDTIAKGNLPFFGRAYSLPYGENGGIEFDGLMKDKSVQIIEKKKKKSISYRFNVRGKNDSYQFSIEMAPEGSCSVNLTSNNRTQISYSGTVSPIEEK